MQEASQEKYLRHKLAEDADENISNTKGDNSKRYPTLLSPGYSSEA